MNKYKDKLVIIINLVLIFIFVGLNLYLSILLKSIPSRYNKESYSLLEELSSDYTSETITDTQVTLRNDIMYVTKRGLTRPEVKLMSDTYTLPATDSSVTFPSYPGYKTYNDISEDYTNTGYYNYYKYMLLRQGMLSIEDCVNKSLDGSLTQEDLYKHPAIDMQYGAVEGINNAVEKVIIIDPTYRSYHTTGLYLPAGELVSVKIEGLKEDESISVLTYLNSSLGYASGMSSNYIEETDKLVKEKRFDEIEISSQWNKLNTRLPYMGANFKFEDSKTYNIGTPFGGMIHLDVTNTSSSVKLTITGAVEHPHFILGVTSEEYFYEHLKDAPGVGSALDTENGILVGSDDAFRKIEDVRNIALLWHSFFSINENFTGGPYNANNFVRFDIHVPAGAAVYLGNGVSVCPISWYERSLNYNELLKGGLWGVLHEIGHGNASSYGVTWGLGGSQEGEVRNNALIVLAYIKFLDLGTSRSGEHGEFAHAYRTLKTYIDSIKTKADYNDMGYFEALSVYVNIMHSFGVEKFYELMQSYKDNKAFYENKRADFIYRCSLIYKMDFRWYFNEMYKTNVDNVMFNSIDLAYMNSLKEYVPIASNYQGGIDGNKTSGNIVLSAYNETVFDFENNTLSPKEFTIDNIDQPLYGKLVKNDDGTYNYVPPTDFAINDEFSYEVTQFNGVKHRFDVYITLNHHVSEINTYLNTATVNIDEAIEKSKYITPSISYDGIAGILHYNDGILLKTSNFIFKANESKEHVFYLKCDDATRVEVSRDGITYMNVLEISKDYSSYIEQNSFSITLDKDELLYFKIYNVNFGGKGYVEVGLKKGNNVVSIDSNQVYYFNLSKDEIEQLSNYKKIQNYYVSNKDNFVSYFEDNKNEWEVISAPNHQGGNTYTKEYVDSSGNTQTITKNKSDYLIDSDTSTIYHSIWNHSGKSELPHEYTIDTKVNQEFNYYQIYTRNSANALIKKYELYISSDGINYSLISSDDELEYSNYVATISFEKIEGRYLKLLVYTTSGSNGEYFSIISEINAGVKASPNKLIPISSDKVIKGEGYTSNKGIINELPYYSEYINIKNTSLKFSFVGKSFSLYATKGNNFGKGMVFVDSKYYKTIDLNSDRIEFNEIVCSVENLENEQHTVEVVSVDDKLFNLEFIGLDDDSRINKINYESGENKSFIILFVLVILMWIIIAIFIAYTINLYILYRRSN